MNSTLNRIPLVNHKILTIGELPASYLASMTYEEQLLWFCNYLETQLLPKINELIQTFNDTTENLDQKFDEIVADMDELKQELLGAMSDLSNSVDERLRVFMNDLTQNVETIANEIITNMIENGTLIVSLGESYNTETESLTFYINSETPQTIIEDLSDLTDPSESEGE